MATKKATIPEWFRSRSVFITGGTGFMGKVLIYKLLMSCPDLDNLYILIREKRGTDPHSRLQALMQEKPFAVVKEQYPERLKKIVPIVGETTLDGLGLSQTDKEKLINNVTVIFHAAANVRFDMPLKEAVKINTQGTLNLVTLAKEMTRLESLIHVSTAYCQCHEAVLEERAYPVPISPESIIMTVNKMTDDVVEAMTPKLLGEQPNTYAFTKALSENIIENSGLPAGVLRPSIVVASLKEPVVGWVDNMFGPTGLMIGGGKGVIRTMLCDPNSCINIIPCDIAINAGIALAWKVGCEKPPKPIYLNATNSETNPVSWGNAIYWGTEHMTSHPLTGILWYPGGTLTTSKLYYYFQLLFLHYLPAYFIDALCLLLGYKPFLVRVQNKIVNGFGMVQYYTMKRWEFQDARIQELEKELCPSDKETFSMDMSKIVWKEFLLHYILGARQYCLKDDLSTLPRARRVMTYYYIAHMFLKGFFLIFVVWTIYSWLVPYREVTTTLIDNSEL